MQTQVAQCLCGPLTGHLDLEKVDSVCTRHSDSCKQTSCRQRAVCTALSAAAVVVYRSMLGKLSRQLMHSTLSGGYPITLTPVMMSCHKVGLWMRSHLLLNVRIPVRGDCTLLGALN